MKKILTVLAVALSVCLMTALLCVASFAADDQIAYTTKSGDCTVTILKNGTLYVTGAGRTSDETFPNMTGDTANVKGWQKLSGVTITKVIIGKDVTYIAQGFFSREGMYNDLSGEFAVEFEAGRTATIEFGAHSFGYAKLTSFTFPATTTVIGDSAFEGVPFTSFEAPASLTRIGKQAFAQNDSLTSLKLHGNIQVIMSGAFYKCRYLTSVVLPAGTSYQQRAGDNYGIFERCGEKAGSFSVTIEQGVKSIPNFMFRETPLTTLEIPATVTSIGEENFTAVETLTSIKVNAANQNYFTDANNQVLYALNADGTAKIIGFAAHSTNVDVTIPDPLVTATGAKYTVTEIDRYAFDGYKDSKDDGDAPAINFILKAPVKVIPLQMFRGAKLNSVVLPEGLEEISAAAFKDCRYIVKDIVIPASVTTIGNNALALHNTKGSGGNMTITFAEGSKLTWIGACAFNNGSDKVEAILGLPTTAKIYGTNVFQFGTLKKISYTGTTEQWFNFLYDVFVLDASADEMDDYNGLLALTLSNSAQNTFYNGYTWTKGVACLGDASSSLLHTVTCDACKGTGKCATCDGTGKCGTCKGTGLVACTADGCVNGKIACPGFDYNIACTTCDGTQEVACSGIAAGTCVGGKLVCTVCGGTGFDKCTACQASKVDVKGVNRTFVTLCATCGGDGKIGDANDEDCTDCAASGWIACATCGGDGVTDNSCTNCTAGVTADDCTICGGDAKMTCPDCADGTESVHADCVNGMFDCKDPNCLICGGKGKHVCMTCNGAGSSDCATCGGDGLVACPDCTDGKCADCDSTGLCDGCGGAKVVKVICNHYRATSNCTTCGGTGYKLGETCTVCQGTGKTAFQKVTAECVTTATCATYAYDVYKCDLCGAKIKVITNADKPAHKISSTSFQLVKNIVEVDKDKTIVKDVDRVVYVCTVCGQTCDAEGNDVIVERQLDADDPAPVYENDKEIGNDFFDIQHAYNYVPNYNGDCTPGNGTMTGTCTICGKTQTVKDPTTTVHQGEWTVLQEATCTAPGFATRQCTVCKTYESKTIEAIGHNMSEYVPDGNAICVAGYGTKTSVCANCDLKVTVTDEETVNPNNHVFMNGACYFCGLKQSDYTGTTDTTVPGSDTAVTGSQDTSGNKGDTPAVDTGDSLVVVVAVAVMAIGTAVIVKKVR